jgi:hypothetical protein
MLVTADVGAIPKKLLAKANVGQYGADVVHNGDSAGGTAVPVVLAESEAAATAARAALGTPAAGTVTAGAVITPGGPPWSFPGHDSLSDGWELWAVAVTGATPQRVSAAAF